MKFYNEDKHSIAERQMLMFNKSKGKGNCPFCNGKGFVMVIKEWDGNPYPTVTKCKDCSSETDTERNLKQIGADMNPSFENYKVENKWQGIIKKSAEEYNERFFFVGGQSGCGKTHICTAIIRKYAEQNLNIKIFRWNEDSKRLKALVNDGSYDLEINEYKGRCDVLYIDDLFKGAVTDADIKLAFEIIDYRYRNRMKTLISSEWHINEIKKIDEAVGGRIEEMAKGHCHNIGREDARNWRAK